MTIETLVATVDQEDLSLDVRMNLQTDAIIANQGSTASTKIIQRDGRRITYLNTRERGVGRNRNLLLQHASAELCIFADDDMRFLDGYPAIAAQAAQACPDADILVFNLIEAQPRRYVNRKIRRVRWYNYSRYGAARLAVRRQPLADAGIRFSLLFGGGARYGSGEDTIFLHDCLKKGLRIYAVPFALAEIDQQAQSTWFTGFHREFFQDKGALYAHLHPVLCPVYALRFLLHGRKKFGSAVSLSEALRSMRRGALAYRAETRR